MAISLTEDLLFETAHAHVAKWEGGFFDHPSDPGGVTNYGVSLMFLKSLSLIDADIDGDGDIDRADVLKITKQNAKSLFRKYFWDIPHAATLPPLVSVAFYDLAVNAGTGRSAIVVQQAINQLVPGSIARLAPNLGPLTRKHTHLLSDSGRQLELAETILEQRAAWYQRLASAKKSSAVFLKGWLNRTLDCRTLVAALAKEWDLK